MDDVRGRYRARTLIRNGPAAEATVLAETRPFGDSETILVPELVAVAGPWTFQSEYLATWVSNARSTVTGPSQGTAFYHACNVEVLYFLTGEHREYNRAMPSFGRVVPHENFFFLDGSCARLLGRGAWQVGLRYCYLDLSDRGFAPAPATLHDVTVGLNWFLNPNMKVQWNYSWAFRDIAAASEGDVNFFGMRFAMDF